MVPILIFSIPIVAILSGVAKRWMLLKEKQLEVAAHVAGEQAAQYAAKIERLEAHVAVLNRIVTDRNEGLAVQIEGLRDPPAAKIN
jgi:hypothetical protein